MRNTTFTLAGFCALAATTASCGIIIGLNKDYQETSSSSGVGGTTSASISATGSNSGSSGSNGSSGTGVVAMPGCAGLPATCGAGNEDCCTTLPVEGGTFFRDNNVNDMTYKATVSKFNLDKFEVTLGRFRRFVEGYPGNLPAAGGGAHPAIPMSGWDPIWQTSMPKDKAALISAIKTNCNHPPDPYFPVLEDEMPGPNENKPINCIDWYMAFAFCAWDGGRLPTNAELSFAESGGAEQRLYPWGSQPADGNHASYNCMGDNSAPQDCMLTDLLDVGSRPPGNGKYGQADLAGNVWEWVLDTYEFNYQSPCVDCATLGPSTERTMRGGGWGNNEAIIQSDSLQGPLPNNEGDALGVRCARK